ncbi:MAG: uridine diphosphate-N-acetylglucosamine-binding protein YvcK [Acidobacteria bacterium]|nr:uridine diphosphate-N-acetylglucosamine-binding protein YvcK [Acidobacteriota bacterium]
MLRFAGVGGGTGLSVLLRGLKELSNGAHAAAPDGGISMSAIVCVSDNGGSTGYLRQSFRMPAVGDLRNCLVALADGDSTMAELFQYRFSGGNGLDGHSLGNLIVTALFQLSGSLAQAVELAQTVLGSRGCVLPVTETAPSLCAELQSGKVIRGESQITAARGRIKKVWLDPDSPPPAAGVLQAISCADAIVLGPGSLYTSIVPNLLVRDVAEAVRKSQAVKIFVCNLMTQPGETDGMTAAAHLRVLQQYLGFGGVDICILNAQRMEPSTEQAYRELGSEPVTWDEGELTDLGAMPVAADILAESPWKLRHDSCKLARLVVTLTCGIQRARDIFSGEPSLAV